MEPNLSVHPLCSQSHPKQAVSLDVRSLGRPLNAAKGHLEKYFNNGVKALENQLCAMTRRNDCLVSLLRYSLEPKTHAHYNDDSASFNHELSAGLATISAEQPLMNQVADAYYGGSPKFVEQISTIMNASEQRVQARLGATILSQLSSEWRSNNETVAQSQSVLHVVYAIQIGELYGELSVQLDDTLMLALAMPATSQSLDEKSFSPRIQKQLQHTPVVLKATLCQHVMPLSQVLNLKAGDIVGADIQDTLRVYAGPMALFNARIAEKNSHLVLQVTSHISPSERV